MGRATDPGENHDPGNDQRFTPSLTQEPRLENGLRNRRVSVVAAQRQGRRELPHPGFLRLAPRIAFAYHRIEPDEQAVRGA